MTRSRAGWLAVTNRFRLNAQDAEHRATRLDALVRKHEAMEDTLVADIYAEAANRALQDAEFWRDRAARAEAYAVDAELPVSLTVVGQ